MKIFSSKFLIALALAALRVSAASVTFTSATTCVTDIGSVTGPSSCSVADSLGNSFSALASGSYSLVGNSLSVNLQATATQNVNAENGPIPQRTDSSSATSAVTINLVTGGTARQGYVELVAGNGVGFSSGGSASFGFDNGTIQYCAGTGAEPLCSLLFDRPGQSDFIPFTLGTDFQFTGSAAASTSFFGRLGTTGNVGSVWCRE